MKRRRGHPIRGHAIRGPLGALAALALLAAACGTPGAYRVGQNDINPTPSTSVASGGTLNWPITALPSNFNVNTTQGSTQDDSALLAAVMPQVFTFNASAQPVLDTDYVTSAAITATSPHQVVTYQINPKATWTDGTPITEADFAAQFAALNGSNPAYQVASSNGYNQITSVAAGADSRQVVVTFAQPYAQWQGLFSPLYPASLNDDPSTFNGGWVTGTVTSAGPFVYQNLDPTAQTITLVRSPAWWGPQPKLSSVVFHAVGEDPSGQLAALKKGTVDFVQIPPEASDLHTGRAIGGTVVRDAGQGDFRVLALNGQSPTLRDQRVRQAVALAIDRPAIAKAVLGPLGVPDGPMNNHFFLPNQHGYQNNAGAYATQDATRAEALLQQAGWKLVKGVRTKGSQPMDLSMVIPSGTPAATTESKLIKANLLAVGIPLQVQTVPLATFFSDYVASGEFDLTAFSWAGSPFTVASQGPLYLSPTTTGGQLNIGENYSGVGTNAIDNLLARATGTLSPADYDTFTNEADAQLWQLASVLPLYQRPEIVIQKSTLANFGAFGFASWNFITMGFTRS